MTDSMGVGERETSSPFAVQARDIVKTYVGGDGSVLEILRGVEIGVAHGEAVAIVGASGAGKSTFLHLLGALDRPTSGTVFLGGRAIGALPEEELAAVRNRYVGFVFQFHHLLREFTALENVMLPRLVGGRDPADARAYAHSLLHDVGLSHRADHKPRQLSGGEQQRVAVARALANEPLVLLADEPSGNLDTKTSAQLHDLLFRLREGRKLSLVIVTHNQDLAGRADRILELSDGRLHPHPAG